MTDSLLLNSVTTEPDHSKINMTGVCTYLVEGRKYDQDKLRWDLLPIAEVEDIVKILTFGAAKYADNNWQVVDNGTERYYAAMLRHLVAWRKGELIDPESGESHLSHAACCLLFLMWLEKQNKNE